MDEDRFARLTAQSGGPNPRRPGLRQLVIAATIAIVPEFAGADKLKPDRRTLRIAP